MNISATRDQRQFSVTQHRPPALNDLPGKPYLQFLVAADDGDRAYASGRGITGSAAFNHDADGDRVLRCCWKRDPPSPSLFLDAPCASHFRADHHLAIAVRHVPSDRLDNDPARMIPNCFIIADRAASITRAHYLTKLSLHRHFRIGASIAASQWH